jgi:hypothetical protein
MANCEYKRANRRAKTYCEIDRRHCDYKGPIDQCPVYHHFQNLQNESFDIAIRCLSKDKRKLTPDIVINIKL